MLFSSQVALTCSGLFGPESSWPPLLSPTNKERFKCQMRDTRIPLSNQIAQFLFFPQWNSRGEEKKRLQSNRGSVSHRASFPGLLRFIVSSGPNWGALLNPPPALPAVPFLRSSLLRGPLQTERLFSSKLHYSFCYSPTSCRSQPSCLRFFSTLASARTELSGES